MIVEWRTVNTKHHCHTGLSPLRSVLARLGTLCISLCISLCILGTSDDITWTPSLYKQGKTLSIDTRPTNRVLLLASLLRGLRATDPEVDFRDLYIHLPDQSLVKSFRTPPNYFSNEVVETHFEIVRLHLIPSRSVCYAATPPALQLKSLAGPALGTMLVSA